MSSALIPFDAPGGSGNALPPAHLQDIFGDDENVKAGQSVNSLSYRGKVWRTHIAGEETTLTHFDTNLGEDVPVQIVHLVVVGVNPERSRAYYEGDFEEGKNKAPTCRSANGKTPDPDVESPCAQRCDQCPMAVKGSKISEGGKATTLCTPHKRLVVAPAEPKWLKERELLQLKAAQTSIWDGDNGENEAKGWYAWDQYLKMLRARGVKHTAAVITSVRFDSRVAYPKLLFKAANWLPAEAARIVKGRIDGDADIINDMLYGTGDPQPGMAEAADQAKEATRTIPAHPQATQADELAELERKKAELRARIAAMNE